MCNLKFHFTYLCGCQGIVAAALLPYKNMIVMKKSLFVPMLAMLLFACKKDPLPELNAPISKTFLNAGFNRIKAGNNIDLSVYKSSAFSIKATGGPVDVNDIVISVLAGELRIGYINSMVNRARVVVEIGMPSFVGFEINKAVSLNVSGFAETAALEGKMSDHSKATISMSSPAFKLDVAGKSEVTVSGASDAVDLTVADFSKANTYAVPAKLAKVVVANNAQARVFSSDELFAAASGNSFILFKGNPGGKFFSEYDTSGIIED